MRKGLVTIGACAAGAAAVLAGGWALQAEALPQPLPAARVAGKAAGWLATQLFAVDVVHAHHERLVAACLEGWFRPHGSARAVHGSLVSFRHGPLLLVAGRRVSVLRGTPLPFLPGSLAAAAACPRVLAHAVEHAAEFDGHLTVERSRAANQPALALHFRRGRKERVALYVSPRGDRPLVAIVARGGLEATARIFLRRATGSAIAHFGMRVALPRRTGPA